MLSFQFKPINSVPKSVTKQIVNPSLTSVKLTTMSFMSKGVKSCSSCR